MPLAGRWSVFDRESISRESDAYGVYELGDANGDIVYVGHGRVLDRLMESKRKAERGQWRKVRFYRFAYSGTKLRAEQMERAEMNAYHDQHGDYPYYNKKGPLAP